MHSLQDIWGAPPSVWDDAPPLDAAAPLPCDDALKGFAADPPAAAPVKGAPATPAGAFCALRRGGAGSSSMGCPDSDGTTTAMPVGAASPIKAGARGRAGAGGDGGRPSVSLVAGAHLGAAMGPLYPVGNAKNSATASPLSARSALAGGGGGATAGSPAGPVGWIPTEAAEPAADVAAEAGDAAAPPGMDAAAARVTAAAAALAAALGAGPPVLPGGVAAPAQPAGSPPPIDFPTVYAFIGSLFDEACAGVDHAAVLQELTPLDRAACVACLRCVSEFLRSPESLNAAERDLAHAAALDEAAAAGWAPPRSG